MIGQIVQSVKDNLPHDAIRLRLYPWEMAKESTATEFELGFLARTAELRKGANMTAAQMATALGIPAERYRKYETRTPMPHDLMERFALITHVSLEYLITGKIVRAKETAEVSDLGQRRAAGVGRTIARPGAAKTA